MAGLASRTRLAALRRMPRSPFTPSARSVRRFVRVVLRGLMMVWIVATITFVVVRALPGNPVDIYVQDLVNSGVPAVEAQKRASRLLAVHVDAPLIAQYGEYLANTARGDLGLSLIIAPGQSVASLLAARLPWTLFSVGLSMAISFWLGVRLGLFAAYRRNERPDHVITNASAVVDSIPAVVLAVVAVLLIGVVYRLLPVTAMRGALSPGVQPALSLAFITDALYHVAVPGLVYVVSSLGAWVLAMRSSAMAVLGEDYVLHARARGLPESRIRGVYVGRNARLPLVTAFALSLGFAVGGSVLIEQLFVYPGVGLTLAQAVTRRDYPVMQGVLLLTTVAVVVATSVADAVYGYLDPRLRVAAADV